jgi:hypothetical protein
MNTESCINYGRACKFMDFCSVWSNPLQHCSETPTGFVKKYWNPSERDETAGTVMYIKEKTT